MNALEMALEALTNPSTISVSHAIELIQKELAKPKMPTKIFGPNLEQILNAAKFYRREWVGLTDSDMHTIRDDAFVKNVDDIEWALQMARRIEAKLKERNGG